MPTEITVIVSYVFLPDPRFFSSFPSRPFLKQSTILAKDKDREDFFFVNIYWRLWEPTKWYMEDKYIYSSTKDNFSADSLFINENQGTKPPKT